MFNKMGRQPEGVTAPRHKLGMQVRPLCPRSILHISLAICLPLSQSPFTPGGSPCGDHLVPCRWDEQNHQGIYCCATCSALSTHQVLQQYSTKLVPVPTLQVRKLRPKRLK